MLALLDSRLALNVNGSCADASELVAQHMATCIAITEERDKLFIRYPSEPILAAASAQLWNRNQKRNLRKALEKLVGSIRIGDVEAGYRGELVARILLCMAYDSAAASTYTDARRSPFTKPVTVEAFLLSLGGQALLDSLVVEGQHVDKAEFLRGLVYLTHFVAVKYPAGNVDFRKFFVRGAGILCKPLQIGIDLMIPIWLSEAEMTYILIQVRNNRAAKVDSEATGAFFDCSASASRIEKNPSNAYLVLYMQVGTAGVSSKQKSEATETEDASSTIVNLRGKFEYIVTRSMSASSASGGATQFEAVATATASKSEEARDVKQQKLDISPHPENKYAMVVGLFGLSPEIYPFLDDELTNLLCDVRDAFPDPMSVIPDDKKVIFKDSMPLEYNA
jgi:hypothetical protein